MVKAPAILLGILFVSISLPGVAAGFEHKSRFGPLRAEAENRSQAPGRLLIMDRHGSQKNAGTTGSSTRPASLAAGSGKHRLSFSYHGTESLEGSPNFSGTLFNGRTFSLSEEVARELDYGVYDFIYQYDVANFQNPYGEVTVGLVGQFKLMEGRADTATFARQQPDDFSASLPLVGIDLSLGILGDLLQGRFRAAGMGSNQGNVFDGQAELTLSPSPYLGIYGGYRFFVINLETNEVKIDYDKSGPYLGLTLSF